MRRVRPSASPTRQQASGPGGAAGSAARSDREAPRPTAARSRGQALGDLGEGITARGRRAAAGPSGRPGRGATGRAGHAGSVSRRRRRAEAAHRRVQRGQGQEQRATTQPTSLPGRGAALGPPDRRPLQRAENTIPPGAAKDPSGEWARPGREQQAGAAEKRTTSQGTRRCRTRAYIGRGWRQRRAQPGRSPPSGRRPRRWRRRPAGRAAGARAS